MLSKQSIEYIEEVLTPRISAECFGSLFLCDFSFYYAIYRNLLKYKVVFVKGRGTGGGVT